MAVTEAPILSRLDRLDNVMRQLEEIRSTGNRSSPKSSCASSPPSSGTLTSDGHVSSVDFSPKMTLEKHCRPIDNVIMETEAKGSLVERLDYLEDRLIKLCVQVEEEIEAERKKEGKSSDEKKKHKKGLKQLIKKVVHGSKKNKPKGVLVE